MPTCVYKPKPFNHTSLIPSSLIGIGIPLVCGDKYSPAPPNIKCTMHLYQPDINF